jgi:hypothetical protein
MAACARVEVRAVINVVLGIDVGPGVNQHLRGSNLVAVGDDKQRRCSGAVARIDRRRPLGQQLLNAGDISFAAAACNEVSFMAAPDATEEMQASARDTAPVTKERRSIFSIPFRLEPIASANAFHAASVTPFK